MSLPRIGVTLDEGHSAGAFPLPRHELKKAYTEAVLEAGGLPLLLAPSAQPEVIEGYLSLCDGLLVTGGAFDVPPELYGETARPGLGELRPARTAFESMLISEAISRDLPLLGICGGMQLLNVVRGGSLFQDVLREVPRATSHEQQNDRREPSHEVEVAAGTRLAGAVGAGLLRVNSTHHQAVKELGRDLQVSAVAPDGIIEGIEATAHRFAVGVQWHPELLTTAIPAHGRLYRAFIEASAKGR